MTAVYISVSAGIKLNLNFTDFARCQLCARMCKAVNNDCIFAVREAQKASKKAIGLCQEAARCSRAILISMGTSLFTSLLRSSKHSEREESIIIGGVCRCCRLVALSIGVYYCTYCTVPYYYSDLLQREYITLFLYYENVNSFGNNISK